MVRNFILIILFILAYSGAANAQQVMYYQSFEDTGSLFQDYVLSNLDKGDPAGTTIDTLKTVPWYVTTAGSTGNHAAVATSNYDPALAADDWFVTPAIRLGKSSKLSWKNLSLTAGKTDSYQVYVSTTEQSVSGCLFNNVAGSYTSANSTAFSSNTLDLAAAGYANKVVFIGFRLNTQSGGDKLAIDDIKVTEDSTQFVSLTFKVNMLKYKIDSLFNPRKDTVDVAGTFNNFNGKKSILSIVPNTDSTVYSITIPGFLVGDRLEFKFRINSTWHDSICEFPYGQPNRLWVIQKDKYTYTCNYNDERVTYGIPENALMEHVKLYPNPAQSFVIVEYPESVKRIELVSLTGSKVLRPESLSGFKSSIAVDKLAKGTYIILFYTREGLAGSRKLIKK